MTFALFPLSRRRDLFAPTVSIDGRSMSKGKSKSRNGGGVGQGRRQKAEGKVRYCVSKGERGGERGERERGAIV